MGLGAYPAVTRADASRAAEEARALIRAGVNPIGSAGHGKPLPPSRQRSSRLRRPPIATLRLMYHAGRMISIAISGRRRLAAHQSGDLEILREWAHDANRQRGYAPRMPSTGHMSEISIRAGRIVPADNRLALSRSRSAKPFGLPAPARRRRSCCCRDKRSGNNPNRYRDALRGRYGA